MSKTISIENAKIIYRNFSGKEGQYNPKGKRGFGVLLDENIAKDLKKDGWNVRYLEPKDPEDDVQAFLPVGVKFNFYPPKITLIKESGKVTLKEEDVGILDWVDIKNVDLIINPYNWEVNGKSGIKAYLKTMYIVIEEDEFETKYRNLPDSAVGSLDDDSPPWN